MKIYIKKTLSVDFIVDQTLNIVQYFKVVFVCSDEVQGKIWDIWSDRMHEKDSLEFYRIKFVENLSELEEDEDRTMIFILNPESVSYGEFHKYGRHYKHVIVVGMKCGFEGYPGVEVK